MKDNDLFVMNYDAIISDLHRIIEKEYDVIDQVSPVKEKLVSTLVGINSFGLLDASVATELQRSYHSDNDFRRLWGSIATQFGFRLRFKYRISTQAFTESILSYLNLDGTENVDESSYTETSILEVRLGMSGFDNHTLLNPNDFWIICFMLTRLTIEYSTMVSAHMDVIRAEVAKIRQAQQLAAIKAEKINRANSDKKRHPVPVAAPIK